MAKTQNIVFKTAGRKEDEAFIREYVWDAIERLENQPSCEAVGFMPLTRKAHLAEMNVDGGVLLRITGTDVDRIVEQELDHWDALVSDGFANEWTQSNTDEDLSSYLGENGADLYAHLELLSAKMSKLVFEDDELTRPVDPLDEYPEEERDAPLGVGWWRLLHLLTVQQNYRYEEEIDAFAEGMVFALRNIARFDDHERAEAKIDGIIRTLEAVRKDLGQIEAPHQ